MKRLDSKSLRKFMELVFGVFLFFGFFFCKPNTSIEFTKQTIMIKILKNKQLLKFKKNKL